MTLIVPLSGEEKILKYMLNNESSLDQVIHLYQNDISLSQTTVVGNFVELTASGYLPVTLSGGSWSFSPGAQASTASYTEQTFTFTTSATAYGYYVTTTSNDLLWAERFTNAPFVLPGSGGQVAIALNINITG